MIDVDMLHHVGYDGGILTSEGIKNESIQKHDV